MKVKYTPQERNILDVCNIRKATGKSCRGCIYAGECAALAEILENKIFELKENLKWLRQTSLTTPRQKKL